MAQNIGFKITKENGDAYSPITLRPGQASAFDLRLQIIDSTVTTDASAVISAIGFTGSQMSINIATPVTIYDWDTSYGYATINVCMTGTPNTYIPDQLGGVISVSALSPWISGDATQHTSSAFEEIEFTSNPLICSFNFIFSTLNVSPCAITGFTAVVSGNQAAQLSWTNPTAGALSAIKIVYKAGSYPTTIADGTVITLASSETSKLVTGLAAETQTLYAFNIYAIDTGYEASAPAQASVYTVWQGSEGGRVWSSHQEHMRMRNLGYI